MTPEQAIAQLDRALALNGQPAILRRLTGTSNQVPVDAAVTVFSRRADPTALVGAQVQVTNDVVISPSDLDRARWPGPAPANYVGDWAVPRKGDLLIGPDGQRQVMAAAPKRMAGILVRIDLLVQG